MKITKELLEQMIEEAASEYVYGVKNPGRVANQYKIKTIKKVIFEELSANLTEDGHEDTSSAIRKLKTSIEDAGEILQGLQTHHGDLPSWWMGKVTIAADYLNKARDYFLVSGDVMQEELALEEGASMKIPVEQYEDFKKRLEKFYTHFEKFSETLRYQLQSVYPNELKTSDPYDKEEDAKRKVRAKQIRGEFAKYNRQLGALDRHLSDLLQQYNFKMEYWATQSVKAQRDLALEQELDERCQKGYKTHPTQKTKEMYGKTYRNCIKAEGMEEDAMDEIFGLTNNISSNILHLSKEDRALIERDLEEIRELAQMEVMDERKLKPDEKRKLKRLEKEVPKKDFTDQYGKEGESIYYATLTKMAKKDKKK